MIYLLGNKLPEDKALYIALLQIYGIGLQKSSIVCKKLGITKKTKATELTIKQKNKLPILIKNLGVLLQSDLKRSILNHKKHLLSLRLNRSIRNKQGLPVRGQRTHTNAKTAKKIR
jgi:small subunit ribosomal protein S13